MSDGLNEIFKNNTEISPQKLDVDLALKLSKIVHDKCKGVPHDIGITLAIAVTDNKEGCSDQKIKECPFCGDKEPFVERMELYSYAVRCNNCLATGNWSDEDTEKSEEDHEKEAIENWNKRV